ncbi:MAG: hypothetical protein J0H09_02040 [Burkholderiales bacterium]|nr:hypothetical protein [Burkholderiales bacterium]
MRRWFLTAFIAYFCISAACFSVGHLNVEVMQAQIAKIEAMQSDAPRLVDAFIEANDHGHALLDEHVDAEEIIHTVTSFQLGQTDSAPHSFTLHERRSPILAVLHRPPIARLFV